jgi:hypothetical protein
MSASSSHFYRINLLAAITAKTRAGDQVNSCRLEFGCNSFALFSQEVERMVYSSALFDEARRK